MKKLTEALDPPAITRRGWFSARKPGSRQRGGCASRLRPFRLEPLEDRQLLSAGPQLLEDINEGMSGADPKEIVDVGGTAYSIDYQETPFLEIPT